MAAMRVNPKLLLSLVTLSVYIAVSSAMKQCYVCSGKFPDRDCELYPQYVTSGPKIINCTRNFCSTIARYKPKKHLYTLDDKQEIIATSRPLTPEDFDVDSIARECEDYERGNSCLMDTSKLAITCNSICDKDLCNKDVPSPIALGVSTIATSPTTTTTTTTTTSTTYYTPEYSDPPSIYDPSTGDYRDTGDMANFDERDVMYGDQSNYDYDDPRAPGYGMDDYNYEDPSKNATDSNEMGDQDDQTMAEGSSAAAAILCQFWHIAASILLACLSHNHF